ncbi:MAG: hypothetical protein MUF19_01755 [Candidatus Pacebacteria bacterium]|jgi:RimK family alpha-L-glutamate ligase|nr:hypothetical protein [Candidatus Paceibacterota bacterium]
MKVTLVSKGTPIYEMEQLVAELKNRNCEVNLVNPLFSLTDIVDDNWWKTYTDTDILYYRTGLGDAPRTELWRRLSTTSVRCLNAEALANQLLSNKVYQAIQILKAGLVPVPKTIFGRGHSYQGIVNQIGAPFVLKAAQGIQGEKVLCIATEGEYNDSVTQLSGDILMQEYIPNSGDYRVFVVGGVTKAIFKRVPKQGDFRANMSQGGSGEPVNNEDLRTQLSQFAESIVSTLNLEIAGIDLMQHKETGKLYFIESNINPGWKGLDETLGTTMAATIADYLLLK